MKILQIKSSILDNNSTSNKYSSKLIDSIKHPNDEIIVRDVSLNPVTPLSGSVLGELGNPNSAVAKEHNYLIEEIKSADIVVIGAPMYNFSIPSTLKNYFDAITKAGITFKYNEQGQPFGFLSNKKTYVIISRGGKYKEQGITFQEDYLKMQLGFIGLTDVKFIFIEGLAMGLSPEIIQENFNQQLELLNNITK